MSCSNLKSGLGVIFLISVVLLWPALSVFGLKCHTCMFMGGVIEDVKCKDVLHLSQRNSTTHRPCNTDTDALNWKQIQAVRQMTPDTQFKLGCLKTIIKTEEVDIVIRGCYGREQETRNTNTRYSSPNTNNVCESPQPNFWKQLKDGPLANATKPLDITNAKLDVCVCSDMDLCNGGISILGGSRKGGLLTLLSIVLVIIIASIIFE